MNVDIQNAKLKNATMKIELSNTKEESKSNYYESSRSEGDWDSSKSNNAESLITKHKELQNLWSQYFRDGKTKSDLTKERPPFLLKKKTVYNIFKRLREKGAYIRKKGSGRKSNWDDDLKNHIEEKFGEDSDLEVNEVKDRLVEKEYKLAYSTLCMYLNKIGFRNKILINDLMNLTTAQKEKKIYLVKKYKDYTWENVIFSDETIFSDFRKSRKKEKFINLQKQEKENIK